MISSLYKLGILVTHYQTSITEAPSQIITISIAINSLNNNQTNLVLLLPSSTQHDCVCETPDPGRDRDGNRIIAQTLLYTHGLGGAAVPEPLTLFTEYSQVEKCPR